MKLNDSDVLELFVCTIDALSAINRALLKMDIKDTIPLEEVSAKLQNMTDRLGLAVDDVRERYDQPA